MVPTFSVAKLVLLALLVLHTSVGRAAAASLAGKDREDLKQELRQELLSELRGLLAAEQNSAASASFTKDEDMSPGRSRKRRFLGDTTTIRELAALPNYVDPSRIRGQATANPEFIPTTAAQSFLFFKLTSANAGTVATFFRTLPVDTCLASVMYMRCTNATCSSLTRNNVAQKIYSFNPDPASRRFNERGAGSTGPSAGPGFPNRYRPVVGNGVRALVHFSPDGVQDFVIPASFDEDVPATGMSTPTTQCGTVWRYQGATVTQGGYVRYQDCIWSGKGTRHVAAFKINGEQFLLHTSMVDRHYVNGTLAYEQYRNLPNFLLKWSSRTRDNRFASRPFGFFLSGGENLSQGASLPSSDPAFSPFFGNNGANTFQNFYNLTGVVHVEHIEILGQHLLAFSEYVSNDACPGNRTDDTSLFPACWDVEIESHVYLYNPELPNPRGDCTPAGLPVGCQTFEGRFQLHQAISTKGARSMHFFTLESTAQRAYFLAVAESHDNKGASVESSIWRWNGREFGRHQYLNTSFAQSFSSFKSVGRTFLVAANRGCPELDRDPSGATDCSYRADNGGTAHAKIWRYDPAADLFVQEPETLDTGTLHALDFKTGGVPGPDGSLPVAGLSQLTNAVATKSLTLFTNANQEEHFIFLAVANARPRATTLTADGTFPPNFFSVSTTSEDGLTKQVESISLGASDNALFLENINTRLTGGDGLYLNLQRDTGSDLRLFGASAATSFLVGVRRYIVLAFDRAHQTPDECVTRFANASSPELVCKHLSPADRVVASLTDCELACDGDVVQSLPFADRRTETLVYRIDQLLAPDGSAQQPIFNLTQAIPSLGVGALHIYQQTEAATQESYEACIDRLDPACYLNQPLRDASLYLAIANTESSCEMAPNDAPLPPDPERIVQVYRFNAANETFDKVTSFVNTTCQVKGLHHFSSACQRVAGLSLEPPECDNYMALVEDCRADNAYRASAGLPHLGTSMRVSFHRWDATTREYRHCQPYEDPGDPRNGQESPCFQPADRFRAQGMVVPGDEHYFDFPDLLPADLQVGLNVTDDGSGLYTQLEGDIPTGIDFGIPRAQKDVFYRGSVPDRTNNVVDDNDNVNRTIYYLNGRVHYEQVFAVSYASRSSPQVFGLRALVERSAACAARHATTPRRREFRLVQALTATAGGRAVRTFERQSLVGVSKLYAVFPENSLRTGQSTVNLFSSVYVNDVCDEYSQYTLGRSFGSAGTQPIPFAGMTGPVAEGLPPGDTEWCPYSTNLDHFNAWEEFENFYYPVSPCKGLSASRTREVLRYTQRYYNRPPPAALLGFRSSASPSGRYTWPRSPSDPATLSTQEYSIRDYQTLFESRDDALTKLQDLPSSNPLNVAVEELCGSGGQLWLIFANEGNTPSLVATRKRLIFVWRDRFAVGDVDENTGGRFECTATAARSLLQNTEPEVAQLGCFEQVRLALPVNNPEAVDILLFTTTDFLLLAFVNARAVTRDTLNFELSFDPGACLANNTAPGMSTPVSTVALAQFGGLQCRTVDIDLSALDLAELADKLEPTVNLDQLRAEFVTLNTDQTVTGRKNFANSETAVRTLTASEDIVVSGELQVEGDVAVDGNIAVFGMVDGVDISATIDKQRMLNEEQTRRLTELEAAVCRLDSEVDLLQDVVFVANATFLRRGIDCVAVAVNTACFPLAGLLQPASEVLEQTFSVAAEAQLPPSVNITSVRFFSGSSTFYFIVQGEPDSAPALEAAVSTLDLASFTAARYCTNTTVPSPPTGITFLTRTVNFVFLDCRTVTRATLNVIRMVIAQFLATFGVRSTDITVLGTACNNFVVQFYVAVVDTFASDATDSLDSADYWAMVYEELVLRLPAIFADVDEALEYLPGFFVPEPAGSGSGSGESAGAI